MIFLIVILFAVGANTRPAFENETQVSNLENNLRSKIPVTIENQKMEKGIEFPKNGTNLISHLKNKIPNIVSKIIQEKNQTKQMFNGKLPPFLERIVQRVQNYFSIYNPPEYFNNQPVFVANDIAVIIPPSTSENPCGNCENGCNSSTTDEESEGPIKLNESVSKEPENETVTKEPEPEPQIINTKEPEPFGTVIIILDSLDKLTNDGKTEISSYFYNDSSYSIIVNNNRIEEEINDIENYSQTAVYIAKITQNITTQNSKSYCPGGCVKTGEVKDPEIPIGQIYPTSNEVEEDGNILENVEDKVPATPSGLKITNLKIPSSTVKSVLSIALNGVRASDLKFSSANEYGIENSTNVLESIGDINKMANETSGGVGGLELNGNKKENEILNTTIGLEAPGIKNDTKDEKTESKDKFEATDSKPKISIPIKSTETEKIEVLNKFIKSSATFPNSVLKTPDTVDNKVPNINLVLVPPEVYELPNKSCIDKKPNLYVLRPETSKEPNKLVRGKNTTHIISNSYLPPPTLNQSDENGLPLIFKIFKRKPEEPRQF